jgi:DNA polymerase III epsilon subunit family exonuclease
MKNNLTLIFFDLETTGLNPEIDEIIEIGAIKVENDKIKETFHSLVRPDKNIPQFITDLTGISEKEVEKAPRAYDLKEKIENFIDGYPLIAHNAIFDKTFLEKLLGKDLQNEVFDTLELSRLFFPEFYSHSLQNLVKKLEIKSEGPHRALNDTLMLYSVFQKIEKEKGLFPQEILRKFKQIFVNEKNFDSIFGDAWEKTENTGTSLKWEMEDKTTKKLTLPFKNKGRESYFKDGFYYVESDTNDEIIDEIVSISRGKNLLLLAYSDQLSEKITQVFKDKGFSVSVLNNYERFICPQKIQFFLDNPSLIPFELRIHFAILVSYIFKTKDFFVDRAPIHIIKNPILKIFSSCEEDPATCQFKSFCPLKRKIEEIESSEVVVAEQAILFEDNYFKQNLRNRATIVFESFRLPKLFYSYRMDFSFLDLEILLTYSKSSQEKIDTVREIYNSISMFPNGQDITKEVKALKETLSETQNDLIKRFIKKPLFQKGFRDGKTVISAIERDAQKLFKEDSKFFNPIIFITKYEQVGNKEVLMEFTGIKGEKILDKYPFSSKNTFSIVPLFTHSPNYDEFPAEFIKFFEKIHNNVKTAVVLQQQTLMKEIYYSLKNKGFNVKAYGTDSADEKREIDLFLYEISPSEAYREIYIVKFPIIQNNNLKAEMDFYSALLVKNIVYEMIEKSEGKNFIFYFDGKLKNKEFRSTFEDMFISFPLYLEREESLLRIIDRIRNQN